MTRTATLTAGSMFSGIGAMDYAVTAAGFNIQWQIEKDEFCQRVLTHHRSQYWPEAVLHGDAKEVRGTELHPVDLIFGAPRASRTPQQEINEAQQMTAISGRRCYELYRNCIPVLGLSLLKTLLTSSTYFSPLYWLIWKAQGIPRSPHYLFRLQLKARRTNETAYGLWPTPTNSDDKNRQAPQPDQLIQTSNNTIRYVNPKGEQSFLRLSQAVKLWPTATVSGNYNRAGLSPAVKFWATPKARDFRSGKVSDEVYARNSRPLNEQVVRAEAASDDPMNPAWELTLMGLPPDWLDIPGPLPRVQCSSHGSHRGLRRHLRSQNARLRSHQSATLLSPKSSIPSPSPSMIGCTKTEEYAPDTDIPWETYDPIEGPIETWVKRINAMAKEMDEVVMANQHISNERMAIIMRQTNEEYIRLAQSELICSEG